MFPSCTPGCSSTLEQEGAQLTQDGQLFVCDADVLLDGGHGVRFALLDYSYPTTGFVVRHNGQVVAYLNRCAHVPIELDWREGEFFESGGQYLMCATHGAIYEPGSGKCMGGPCRGGRLHPIAVREGAGKIYWLPDERLRAPAQG